MVIHYNIKKYRQAMGWSQRQLSKRSGISQTTISRLERQEGDVSLMSICQLSVALGIPVDKLFYIKCIK